MSLDEKDFDLIRQRVMRIQTAKEKDNKLYWISMAKQALDFIQKKVEES